MAWSDAARRAAAETRRRKSLERRIVTEAHSGSPREYSRVEVAQNIRSIRRILRTSKKLPKKRIGMYKAQLSNFRYHKPKQITAGVRKAAWEK